MDEPPLAEAEESFPLSLEHPKELLGASCQQLCSLQVIHFIGCLSQSSGAFPGMLC